MSTYSPSWLVRVLYPGDERPDGHVILFRATDKPIYWQPLSDLSALDENAKTLKKDDLYISICAQDQKAALAEKQSRLYAEAAKKPGTKAKNANLKHTRGFNKTVCAVPGVWFELDYADGEAHKEGALPTREEAEAFIETLPLSPTLVIASGHGFHLYWLFKQPLVTDTDQVRGAAAQLVERWQAMIQERAAGYGWKLDSTHDLTRVLRPPGTLNHKSTPPKPVTVVSYEAESRYAFTEIEKWLPRQEVLSHDSPAADWTPDVNDVREMLAAINTRPGYRDWFRISAAVLDAVGGDLDLAESLLKEWRAEEVEGEYRAKLESGLDGSITAGTLIYLARQHGWKPRKEDGPVAVIGSSMRKADPSGDGQASGEPVLMQMEAEDMPCVLPEFNHTDVGNGYLMAHLHREWLRYCYPWKQWLAWDGRRWLKDATGEADRRANLTAHAMKEAAANMEPGDERTALEKWAHASESATKQKAMLEQARSKMYVLPEDMDADHDLLNLENGTLDLRTGDLLPHRREHLITKIANVRFDEAARARRWEQFVYEIFDGNEELVRYAQRLAGYSATGSVKEQVLPILYGSGANGKSTFIEVLQEILGDYAQTARADLLMMRRQESGASEGEAALKGARFVAAAETQSRRRLAESVVKRLTGGDTIRARFLHANEFEFKPTHKIWLATNHKPIVGDTDPAIWRRIHLIPFTVRFEGSKRDEGLKEKLLAERSGILNWIIDGCLAWRQRGLDAPAEVLAATQDYKSEMDVLGDFIEDKCHVQALMRADASKLYEEYRKWCEDSGETPETQTQFGIRMSERGFERVKVMGKKQYKGIGLKAD